MRITELISKQGIELDAHVSSKGEAIDKLVSLMNSTGNLTDAVEFKKCVLVREAQGTTGIGDGVAIPHAKTAAVSKPGLAVMVVKSGVDYDALDGEPTKLFFLIASPDTGANVHLDVLARLSAMLMDDAFRESLIYAGSKEELLKRVDQYEMQKFNREKPQAASDGYRLLAVTACPTGIAHTYMAAEALTNKANEMGISIKVETNGSEGAKNVLTKKEIAAAECIIVAADKNIEMARFDGKPVLITRVSKGISKPTELIHEAVGGAVPIYHAEHAAAATEDADGQDSIGRQIYKHLMNGVSHMLPFVIGGGILIALAFLFDDFTIDPKNFGMNTPLAAFLKTVGGAAFGFMLPILAGYIAMSIADRPGLAVGFVGGYLANAGGSGFLGALLAGFIAGYLMLGLRKLCEKLPKSLEGIKPVLIYPFFGILFIGAILLFLVNPPVSTLNTMISNGLKSMGGTSKILLGILLGGMMSVDMGGPVNKAAYVFGTASIASGAFDVMAAVMVGGMVPPLVIALCTTFFKNRFTLSERQSGLTNYIMGLSFISEGAIPFAAADPLRVLPSCIIGSAVAGGLSMFFGCTLQAPHGGIFVFPVVGNWGGYLIALAVGSILGALILAVLKKPLAENQPVK